MGLIPPEEMVAQAQRHGLSAIALTDHDTVEGCERTSIACDGAAIEFIPGTELTAEQDGNELHVLGYFMDVHKSKISR